MQKPSRVKPGDIIAIQLREGMVVAGKVFHVFTLFKNAMMIGFYPKSGKAWGTKELESV
jgi:hypothetical protein